MSCYHLVDLQLFLTVSSGYIIIIIMIMDNIDRSCERELHKTARHYGRMVIRRQWIEECGVNPAVEAE